jgi:hypothetical protein
MFSREPPSILLQSRRFSALDVKFCQARVSLRAFRRFLADKPAAESAAKAPSSSAGVWTLSPCLSSNFLCVFICCFELTFQLLLGRLLRGRVDDWSAM